VSAAVVRKVPEGAMVRATTIIELAVRGDGVAVLTVNDPYEPVNTVTRELAEELLAHVDRVANAPAIKGAVVISAKKDFVVGANIDMLKAVKLASDAEAMAKELALGLVKLAALGKPFVAGGGSRSRSPATPSSPATMRPPALGSRRCSSG
jgi:enoyl-CoA hydratase/carnithine racemase